MRGCTVFLSLVPHFLKIEIWLLSNECEESREDRHHRDRLNAKLHALLSMQWNGGRCKIMHPWSLSLSRWIILQTSTKKKILTKTCR